MRPALMAALLNGTGGASTGTAPGPANVALLTDNANDNSIDSSKWAIGVLFANGFLTTGCTLNETSQQWQIQLVASTSSRAIQLVTQSLWNMTAGRIYCRVPNIASLQAGEMFILGWGLNAQNIMLLEINDGAGSGCQGERWVGGSRVQLFTGNFTSGHTWFSVFDSNDGSIRLQSAPATNNPPLPGDWVTIFTLTNAGLDLTQLKACFGLRSNGTSPAAPTVIQVDGFNCATV